MDASWYRRIIDGEELTDKEELLILWFMLGKSPKDAFMTAYVKTEEAGYTAYQARLILRQPRSIKYMRDLLIKSFEAAAEARQMNLEWFADQLKQAIENAENEKKVRGLRLYAEAVGVGQFNKTPEYDPDQDKLAGAIPIDEVPVIDADIPAQLGTGQDTQ